jgi:hypothetical protein
MMPTDYESSDDAKNLIAAAEREAADAAKSSAKTDSGTGEPLKMASFKEAFKEARDRGDKTFEYMGKKYTTEMAGAKKPAASGEKTQAQKYMENVRSKRGPIGRAMDIGRGQSGASSVGVVGAKKGGMIKSSASKRADGCATKGKTRGKMV